VTDEDDSPVAQYLRFVLMGLQVLAMALCACIVAEMSADDASLPHMFCPGARTHQACLEALPPGSVPDGS
jgi:hypothetical protein